MSTGPLDGGRMPSSGELDPGLRTLNPERGLAYRVATFLLNVQFYALFLVWVLIGIPALALAVAASAVFISHRRAMRLFRRAISWFGWVIIRVLPWPWIRIRYWESGEPTGRGPYIFVGNHRSLSDAFLLALLPVSGVQVANLWPFRIPILGIMARLAGYLSIRAMPIEEFLERGRRLLEEGACIGAFPEGTRSGNRQVGPFHGAVFRLALQNRIPIVPLCISGNERIPARGSLVLRPGLIQVHRLPPVTWEQVRNLSPFQFKIRVRKQMIQELAAIDGDGPPTAD